MKATGKQVIFSFVLLLSGFLVAFSYQQTKKDPQVVQLSDQQLEKDYYYRQQLINIEKQNKDLRNEVEDKKDKIQSLEDNLATQEQKVGNFVEDKKQLQKLTGEIPVQGQGVKVTLKDSDYIPSEENVNQYIVHESHIHKVINELLSSGANAIAINGQRLYRNSYIACTGPVVTVDGVQHPAPFVITAIGDQDVMMPSLELKHGVVDQLVNDNIEVLLEKQANISMGAKVTGER
ncbi:DUF881 domain-containing protein [Pontibacillus yanchengensis]|uniref:DUF881 domain-containing protein n=2 Tax=Pontibacillus yanchengensis TaxID=462910 RepID=A0ACC7VD36_9BACI|nr:DUF881 domain-containing protein [Pontibacillus yanchengensis]MYL33051.1 DUF881 domain-containing protein [Pontibacillus yanchengensis]MYL52099.1 DUF881 domain-containing protein [Pontibacillus yanchengensis]